MTHKPTLMFILVMLSLSVFAQKHFVDYEQFMNKEWKGFYENTSDSSMIQYINWEYDLDSSIVKVIKRVRKFNFRMETTYYWDYEGQKAMFIAFLNKPMNMQGDVSIEGNTITVLGEDFYKGDEQSKVFKQTYTISEDKIVDYFYRKVDGEWEQRHCIIYRLI